METTTIDATPTPALMPPPGTTSNFDGPETSERAMTIAISVVIPLTTICFLLRIYVRIWIRRQWICEDWLVLIAWLLWHWSSHDGAPRRRARVGLDPRPGPRGILLVGCSQDPLRRCHLHGQTRDPVPIPAYILSAPTMSL
ncbi:hypothetical protein FJTKL_14766 [Diaporthe vaccinii]|uniref:Integral membrane protein n=1 Tax=Diaporthe vaccinii TaxID=105482 RepID=A0ABR4F7Z1_9PEZI